MITKEQSKSNSWKHGYEGTSLYNAWLSMKGRCYRPTTTGYENYGGRGITVCEEWLNSFISFKDWALENGYVYGLHLDRENNEGNYEPENCRWITPSQNQRNKRNTQLVEVFGESKCLMAWSEDPRCVVKYFTLNARYKKYGWTIEDALTITSNLGNRIKNKRLEGDS